MTVRLEILAPDIRRRIEGQSRTLAATLVRMSVALGVDLQDHMHWPEAIPPGWWFSPECLGHCTPWGLATIPACGTLGVDHDFRRGDGDFRLQGLAPQSAALVGLHEIGHALLFLKIGRERSEAMLAEAKGSDAEMPAWRDFCSEASRALFGRDLPAGFDFARWPLGAPGSLATVDGLAAQLARFAVPPITEAEAIGNVARFNAECERGVFAARVERMLARYGGVLAA